MAPEEIKELQEDLRVGAILIAKLTDQCRELEAQLDQKARPFDKAQGKPDREKIKDAIQACIAWNFASSLGKGHRQLSWDEATKEIQALFDETEKERITAPIVCLCGSTRFTGEMLVKQWELTKQGNIVVSWCALPDSYFECEDKTHIGDQEGVKTIVDDVHKRKIALCDEVFVLNIDGYIGESTRSEIDYAKKIGKPIKYWQALKKEG